MSDNLCLKATNSIISNFGHKKIINRKILVLGDPSIGKTSLLHVYARDHFPQIFEPTVVENHTIDVLVGEQIVELCLWDNLAEEEDEKPGPGSSYSNSHVVMLCFSVDKPNSLINTENKWLDRIIERCPGVRICLAALRCDLRDDPKTQAHLAEYGQRPIDYEEATRLNRGVSEAFLEVAKVSFSSKSTSVYKFIKSDYRHLERTRNSIRSCLIT
ncbi:hypothetical protein H4Q26_012990 [Puccinia striiformis f. sp. tritici PST-130]|nr:hypothetical protein H4Q26_012990 [Puccinia striiformis f. sp. tritici PST-130]